MTPLSEQMRPKSFDEVIGQDHLLGPKGLLSHILASKKPLSIILWGPPGTGKTSIARLYAKAFNMRFEVLNAIFSGIADIKRIVKDTESTPLLGQQTLLFVDEIHRFNKAQQDAFLPFLENGTLVLVGATAENPSFYLNGALLSRVRVLPLHPLDSPALKKILLRYEQNHSRLPLTEEGYDSLLNFAQGDARYLLNLIENIRGHAEGALLDQQSLQVFLQKRAPLYDKEGDQHYQLISALHKSVRGSDPNASLYWLARMLNAGEDPLFIARRAIRMASEDIGLADPQALSIALSAKDAYEALGSPEGELAIAEAIVYLALAPKSNRVYCAYKAAKAAAEQTSHYQPPKKIINAPTRMMKEMGMGEGYVYDHDTAAGCSGQNYFPDQMEKHSFYSPTERGFEREMCKRLAYFQGFRSKTS